MTITLPHDFSWVLLAGSVIGFQVIIQGAHAGRARTRVFSKLFMNSDKMKTIQAEHKKAFNENVSAQGYPDMGNGRYADLLPYKDWVIFNNAQRAHYNYVEGAASYLFFLLAAGIFYPRLAAVSGFTYALGRELYGLGYRGRGASGRMVGALFFDLALVATFGAAFYGSAQATGLFADPIGAISNLLKF
eukprot:Colp12_sorted_trinity150504_noHs@32525